MIAQFHCLRGCLYGKSLSCNEKSRGNSYRAVNNYTQTSHTDADEALTFKLVETFLESLLPPSIKLHMAEYFQLADNTLKASPLAYWLDKVRIIPNGLCLLPAEIDSVVLPVVYEALLKN